MGQRITIEINKKIATCLTELPIVCGNSDYECEFVFDEEWNEHLIKTARFRVNGEYTDVIFEGNVCNMPIISDAKIVWIGVFAGELSTSTPAIVHCKPSILDGDDVPAPPREDVYSQIVELCEEAVTTARSVEERANNGEFDGEDGKDGADGKDGENGKDGKDGKDGADGKDADTESLLKYITNTFANTIKDTQSGVAIALNGVSPVKHKVDVGLRSKNLIPYPYRTATQTKDGVTFTDNGDGSITINGTPTAKIVTHTLYVGNSAYKFSKYIRCYAGGSATADGLCMSLKGESNPKVGLAQEVGTRPELYIIVSDDTTYDNVTVYPQLEYGTVATPYTPYVADDTPITVKSCGKNILTYPYSETTKTHNGITFTDNGDGTITVNGTATAQTQLLMIRNADNYKLPAGTYTVSGMPVTTEKIAIYTSKGQDWGNKVTASYDGTETFFINITVNKGATADNLVIYPQLEYGTTATAYEPYIEGETIETTLADGAELDSIAPNMTITTDTNGAIIDANYNCDTKAYIDKKFNELATAIIGS